jgi:hypothetical protein
MRFQFIIAAVIAEHILHSTVYLSTFLQDTDYDILEAIKESKTILVVCLPPRLGIPSDISTDLAKLSAD